MSWNVLFHDYFQKYEFNILESHSHDGVLELLPESFWMHHSAIISLIQKLSNVPQSPRFAIYNE